MNGKKYEIKPLEWNMDSKGSYIRADGLNGTYEVFLSGDVWMAIQRDNEDYYLGVTSNKATAEEAKQACELDHTQDVENYLIEVEQFLTEVKE